MIRRLFLLLALGSQLLDISAQTAKTRADLYTQIDSSLPSNSTGAITAATLRTVFKDTIASAYNVTGDNQTAPAWLLPTFTASTISTGQNGLGWDENGRVTLQTPVGALQFYTTGSPSESVIYWPGRIITGAIDVGTITGSISAALISAPTGFEVFNDSILRRSLAPPLDKWQMGQTYAGTAGITYVVDTDVGNSEYEPTIGVYFPQANVTAGGATAINQVAGRYRTATQVKSDLAIAATDLTATGTKDSTTYLRGDNTWATVSGGGAVTSVAGRTGAVTLTTSDVSGLGSAATTSASAYEVAGAAAAAQAAAIAASQPRATTRVVTTSGALTSADAVIVCTGAGGITLTLPAANAATPRPVQLEIVNRTSGAVTLARAGSDLFEGDTSALITAGASWSITSDASANWYLY